MSTRTEKVRVAEVLLGKSRVGYLAGYDGGRNVFVFSKEYIAEGPSRPVLGLAFNIPGDETATLGALQRAYSAHVALPAYFSNLLPEGALRDYVMAHFSVKTEQEFDLLLALGQDLPGAVIVRPAENPPAYLFDHRDVEPVVVPHSPDLAGGFSLAGVQLKFSMIPDDHRLLLPGHGKNGQDPRIVKIPSSIHPLLPLNEYSAMKLAEGAGVEIPFVDLVDMSVLQGLPDDIQTSEKKAYVISRFDRERGRRIHTEDFAQVFGLRPHRKYGKISYDQVARLIKDVFPDSTRQLEKLIRRLVVNVLLGNADAHAKNISLIYENPTKPALAPAYDIVTTIAYAKNTETGLNQGGEKDFYALDENAWRRFAASARLPEATVLVIVRETVGRANDAWPELLKNLPAPNPMIDSLAAHWKKLPDILQPKALIRSPLL